MDPEKDDIFNTAAEELSLSPPEEPEEIGIIDGLGQSELQGRIINSAEIYNLAQDLDEDMLREIGQTVWKGFEDDDATRTPWLEKHAYWLSIYMQQDYAMNADPNRSWGATESIPILMEAWTKSIS